MQSLPKPSATPLVKPESSVEEDLRNKGSINPKTPSFELKPLYVGPHSEDRVLRSHVDAGTKEEIRERRTEQIKKHELCRRLEQRREALRQERKEQGEKASK